RRHTKVGNCGTTSPWKARKVTVNVPKHAVPRRWTLRRTTTGVAAGRIRQPPRRAIACRAAPAGFTLAPAAIGTEARGPAGGSREPVPRAAPRERRRDVAQLRAAVAAERDVHVLDQPARHRPAPRVPELRRVLGAQDAGEVRPEPHAIEEAEAVDDRPQPHQVE